MSIAKNASLRQMFTFRTVARLGSVSMAAEELHLSQSAVSIQIGSLEAAAGAPLVNRTGRGVRLTEAGELLLTYADKLLALWTETSDEVATFLGEFSGTLRVGAVTTAEYWLPRILVKFLSDNPKVKIKLQVANRDEIVRGLASQEVDIAVMGRPPDELKVSAVAIAKNPMAFLSAPAHPLMSINKLTIERLAEEPLLVRERGSGTRTAVERLFRDAGIRMRVGSELSSNEAIKQMCAAGFGPAYLSLHTCILEMNAGLLTMLPLPNNLVEREWFVVHVAAKDLPQVAVAFEHFLRDNAQAEILGQFGGGQPAKTRPAKATAKKAVARVRPVRTT
jgi:LysR family transcriptional regulator, low CO2-responsive transcriptional regulator